MMADTSIASVAMVSETRAPYRTRLSTSRLKRSVPNRCAIDGGLSLRETMSNCCDCAYGAMSGASSARRYRAARITSAARVVEAALVHTERSRPVNSANTDPRVGDAVRDVGQQVADDDHECTEQQRAHDERVIARADRRDDQHSHSGPVEDAL